MTQENKQQAVKSAVKRIVVLLGEQDTLGEDIKSISKDVEERFDIKASLIVAMAKEEYAGKSTEAKRKAEDVIEQLEAYKGA